MGRLRADVIKGDCQKGGPGEETAGAKLGGEGSKDTAKTPGREGGLRPGY